mgnify:CR=1 FL=1
MKYQIVGRNIEVTDSISSTITKKLSKLDKYFRQSEEVLCRVVFRFYRGSDEAKVEVTIFSKDTTFRAEVKNKDLYSAVDQAVDKLTGQLRKLKTQLKRRYEHEGIGKSLIFEAIQEETKSEEKATTVRTKTVKVKPITMENAIIEMESIGHNFYLYLDTDDEKMSVVYKREDGGYGLIQADTEIDIK